MPTLHLHLLRRCNLSCLHCYSSSSPRASASLSTAQALAAIDLARHWGCDNVSVSGGEPLLHDGLQAVLAHARGHGMHAAVVSNGMLLARPGALAALAEADTLCISIDGMDAVHDRLRGRPGALAQLRRTMQRLADAGLRFSVSCGVTRSSLDEIDEVADMVHRRGAVALQLHAVEAAGRAQGMPDELLRGDEPALLYLAAQVLRAQYAGAMGVHVDLLPLDLLLAQPERLHAQDAASLKADATPAEQIDVLVLEPDGALVPVCYGFSRRYGLGQLDDVMKAGADASWQRWCRQGLPALRKLGAATLAQLREEEPAVVNPSEALAAAAQSLTQAAVQPLRYLVPKMRSPASPSPGTM